MYYTKLLIQKINQSKEDFIYEVQEYLNEYINNSSTKLVNINYSYDTDSHYPYECVITFYKDNN